MAHFAEVIPLTVLVSSLIGSGHCVGMCGGLVSAVAQTSTQVARYHGGRLLGYLTLGALAGGIGQAFLGNSLTEGSLGFSESIGVATEWAAAILLAFSFVWIGVGVWSGRTPHFSILPQRMVLTLHRAAQGRAFWTGLLSALLPCGWLHGFVLGAVATRSIVAGTLFLFAFWLGSLPALVATPWVVRSALLPLGRKRPRLSAILLMSAGLMTVTVKMAGALSGRAEGHSCHHSVQEPNQREDVSLRRH